MGTHPCTHAEQLAIGPLSSHGVLLAAPVHGLHSTTAPPEQGTFDSYSWIKAKENPHFIVDWGVSGVSIDEDPVTIAQAVLPQLQEEQAQAAAAGRSKPAVAAASADDDVSAAAAVRPKTWPGAPGKSCTNRANGGRKLLADTVLEEHFAKEQDAKSVPLSDKEIRETVKWMQSRIKDQPHELRFFQ